MSINNIAIWFLIYSFIGWFYESFICSPIFEKKFINRGFLIGPYCPIYGIGAISILAVLGNTNNLFLLFIFSVCICTIVELFAGTLMERLFKATWWDYSDFPLNYRGRICFYASTLFGVFSVILVKYLHPLLTVYGGNLSTSYESYISILLIAIFSVDLILTLGTWTNLNNHLKLIHSTINNHYQSNFVYANKFASFIFPSDSFEFADELKFQLNNLNILIKKNELRIIKAFPKLRITQYNYLLRKIRRVTLKKL